MRRLEVLSLILLICVFVTVFGVERSNAQSGGPIYIKPDGSVVGSDKIQRQRNVYSLTDDLDISPIVVECNNIVLDGKGFNSKSLSGWSELVAINLTASNVTVKNFNFTNYGVGILGAWDKNTITNNNFRNVIRAISIYGDGYTVENNLIQNSAFYAIRILNSHNDTFFRNQILSNSIGFYVTNSSGDIAEANTFENNNEAFRISNSSFQVYHNNFVSQFQEVRPGAYSKLVLSSYSGSNFWDNGYPSGGNFYSDYLTRYPNATEIGNSGIGNIPYQVCINTNFTDRYPLLNPVNITTTPKELPSPTPNSTVLPSPTQVISLTLSPDPSISTNPSSLPSSLEAQYQFKVNNILYGFQASALLCSFHATAGSIVELNVTVKGNNTFETTLEITGKTHRRVFNSTQYGNMEAKYQQTVQLSFDDSYNVTLSKHPFYSDLDVVGTINVHENNLKHDSSPSPSIPEFSSMIAFSIVLLVSVICVLAIRLKH